MPFRSIDELHEALRGKRYFASRGLTTTMYLGLRLGRPIFLEGEAGVGKTEVAKVLAELLDTELIRLQCYEGLDVHHAVYEWNYTRQMMHIRLLEARGNGASEAELFGPEFLLRRPLLRAIEKRDKPAVLLIDEMDRSDEEFEAFLLEILSDFQITIPEIGTIKAEQPPVVVVTSNRTREVHDALKRRCLYRTRSRAASPHSGHAHVQRTRGSTPEGLRRADRRRGQRREGIDGRDRVARPRAADRSPAAWPRPIARSAAHGPP
jgi:MoxR-like ATPase